MEYKPLIIVTYIHKLVYQIYTIIRLSVTPVTQWKEKFAARKTANLFYLTGYLSGTLRKVYLVVGQLYVYPWP